MNNRFITCALALALLGAGFSSCGDDELPSKGNYTPNKGNTNTDKTDEKTDGNNTVDASDLWPARVRNAMKDGQFRAAINYEKHPYFRLACGISVGEICDGNNPANNVCLEHFDEITFGNAQKYASIVRNDGSMDFSNVKRGIDYCKAHNITVFGHTLAWHSQQNVTYLKTLVKSGTDEEKKARVQEAMETWIDACMKETKGYVTCWDAVNEAIAGGGSYNGRDMFVLQGNGNTDPNNLNTETGVFYWQDYLGSEDYIPIVFNAARESFESYYGEAKAKHLKLFINDYNLESDWDDNKKLKSLIEWIKIWESKGCYIDGIGTQMHISCYKDAGRLESVKNHIVNMFKLMAATGKLCKISELDMGYNRGDKNNAQYDDLTDAEAQQMADLYEFVVTQYFKIIPPEQQFGITQWCLADSPKNSGWRAGTPAGFWKLNFTGKWPMFDGFMRGLENSADYEK